MKYALRKLIAFVFLGGIFWFIYQDLGNLDQPWFLHALGFLAVAFAFFWLLVPSLVVWTRIVRRRRLNRVRHAAWRATLADGRPAPLPAQSLRLPLEPGETAYWHEKGTLYARHLAAASDWPSRGAPSDVAFPRFGRSRYQQRTHFYLTDRRVLFFGKGLSLAFPLTDALAVLDAPGGLVFRPASGAEKPRLAFTFQNPLVVRDVLSFLVEPQHTEKKERTSP